MSLEQVASFLSDLKNSDKKEVESALSGCKSLDNTKKLAAVVDGLVSLGTKAGSTFTKEEVVEYFNNLKTQYYTNPTVKILMDSHCGSSCHIGSQLTSTRV